MSVNLQAHPAWERAVARLALELYHESDYGYCREDEQVCPHCERKRASFRRHASDLLLLMQPYFVDMFAEVVEECERRGDVISNYQVAVYANDGVAIDRASDQLMAYGVAPL